MATSRQTIGAKIELEGEKAYREQLRLITQETKTMHAETKNLESTWTKNTTAQQKATQQASLLKDQISKQAQSVETARSNVARFTEAYGENDRRTLQWKEKLAQAETELNNLNQKLKEIPSSMQLYGQQMQDMGSKISNAGKSISTAGQTLTRTVSLPVAAIGTASVKMASDFETSMAKVSTIADETEMSYDDMKTAIVDLSNTTGVAATDVAESVYQAISAGQDTADAVNFVSNSTKLAKAGFADAGDAVDVLTTILNAYGLEAEDVTSVSDKLITTQNLGKTTVGELASSMGKVIPTAAAYNVSLDQLASGYVTLTKNGVSTAEATTYLNSLIDEMGKSGSKSAKVLEDETGKSLKDLMDEGYSLTDCLGIIGEGADDAGVSISDMFTNKNARKAANSLTQNVDDFKTALDNMATSAGATDAAFAKVTDTTAEKFKRTMNELKNTGIDLGESILSTLAPTITDLADDVKSAAEWFGNLDNGTKEVIVKFGLFAAAAGPVVTVTGKLVSGVGETVKGFGKLIENLPTAAAAFGPYGIAVAGAIAAGVALGIGLKELSEKYGGTGTCVQNFSQDLLDTVSAASDSRKAVDEATEALQKAMENASQTMTDAETAAALTDKYVDELVELASKSSLTTEEQYRMKMIVDQLNEVYPGFTEAVMDSNGQLKMGTEELIAYTDQLKETAKAQALQEAYEEVISKIVDAEKKRYEAEQKQKELTDKAKTAEDQRNEVLKAAQEEVDALSEAQTTYQELLTSGKASCEDLEKAELKVKEAQAAVDDGLVTLNGDVVSANDSILTYADGETTASEEADKLKTSIEEADAEIEEADKQAQYYQEQLNALTKSVDEVTTSESDMEDQTHDTGEEVKRFNETLDGYGSKIHDVISDVAEYSKAAADAYSKALDAARESIAGQVGLFDTMDTAVAASVEDMTTALESQVQAYNSMAENLEIAWQYAVDSGDIATMELVRQIKDMGVDGAGYAAALAQAIKDEDYNIVQSISDTAGSVDGAKERYAKICAQVESTTIDTGNGIKFAVESSGQDAVTAMDNTTSGMSSAAASGMGNVKGEIESGMNDTENAISGHRWSLNSTVSGVFAVVGEAARTAASDMRSSGYNTGSEYADGMYSSEYTVSSAASYLGSQAANSIESSGSYAYNSGYNMGMNFANGISSMISYATSAAYSLASSVSAYLHHSTPDKGPLRHDDKWGAEMVEAYAQSMIDAIPEAERAAEMVAEAVTITPPTDYTVEPGVVSGEYVREDRLLLDYEMIYQAVRAGASDADNSVIINNREFGRILRDAGVVMA